MPIFKFPECFTVHIRHKLQYVIICKVGRISKMRSVKVALYDLELLAAMLLFDIATGGCQSSHYCISDIPTQSRHDFLAFICIFRGWACSKGAYKRCTWWLLKRIICLKYDDHIFLYTGLSWKRDPNLKEKVCKIFLKHGYGTALWIVLNI